MSRVYIIAEIGINHNGDINLAKQLIDKAKNDGCDAVKFQKRNIDLVYSKKELDSPRTSPFGTTTREQKKGIEFNISQYKELEAYTKNLKLDFIISCWDLDSVDDVENNLNVKYHKVASAMVTDREFLEKLNETGKPIILSTGMCDENQIERAVNLLDNVKYVLSCTSTYPTDEKEINLRYITTLKNKYSNLKIGFSNHYNGLNACVGAAVLGAECVEFHITLDRTMYGSDQPASIEFSDKLVEGIRSVNNMIGDGIKKVYKTELPIIDKLRKRDTI
tara:strand:+ start:109 stop:939 length:831 start_codon:yes stop_codon:yes gene_type:complete